MVKENRKVEKPDSDQDDDPTAELKVLREVLGTDIETQSYEQVSDGGGSGTENANADETISNLKSELKLRAETIRLLQLELEQLRSRWSGLEKEVEVFEDAANNIAEELKSAHKRQLNANELLAKRDKEIVSLKSQLASKQRKLEELACQTEDARNRAQKPAIESKSWHRDTRHALIEEVNGNSVLLATKEREPEQALTNQYDQDIEKSHETSTADADTNDEPYKLALLVPLDGEASSGHPITTGRLSLGSSPDNDIQIKSNFVSRYHAQIVSSSTNSILGDLNSTNGTYVNSKRIQRHALRHGDSITLGKHRFRYVKQNSGKSDYKQNFYGGRIKP